MFLNVLEFPAYVVQSVTCMFCLFSLHMLSSSLTLLRNEVCFSLQCKAGYGGDGEECEVDPDLDGIPSIGLSCTLPSCYKVFQFHFQFIISAILIRYVVVTGRPAY